MVDYDRFAVVQAQVNAADPTTLGYMSHYRGSPHFSHLDQPSSAPTTPSPPYPHYAQPLLSNVSPQSASRQPTSYPSPSMTSYPYPPSQQQQPVDPYRSPTASTVSLPPIRVIDPRNPTGVPAPMGSPIPAGMGSPTAIYAVPGAPPGLPPPPAQMNITSSPHPHGMRYPLPAPDGRLMSGGRIKKEIKRRTKTGCLTCRRRRIKCDEAHPTCRNCAKSKRECMGYDPIFKSQPGPAPIQPAPSSSQPMTPTMTTPTSTSAPGGFTSMPAGYGAAPAGAGYGPNVSGGASSPGSSVEPFEYSAAIDPALEVAGVVPPPLPTPLTAPPTAYDAPHAYRASMKRSLDETSAYPQAVSELSHRREC